MTSRTQNKQLIPAIVPYPGKIIARELKARHWTQRRFAEILGRPYQVINEIINGKKGITPDISIDISAAFGTAPDFWYRLQTAYDFWASDSPKTKIRVRAIAKRAAEARSEPV